MQSDREKGRGPDDDPACSQVSNGEIKSRLNLEQLSELVKRKVRDPPRGVSSLCLSRVDCQDSTSQKCEAAPRRARI